MNPFRIIILTLLSISLLLMLYVIFILVPERQTEYAQYQSTVQMTRFTERQEAHEARMNQIAPLNKNQDITDAIDEVKESELKREAALADAEERKIIAEARAKEEQALAQAKAAEDAKRAKEDANKAQGFEVIGQIASYDKEWASLVITPSEGALITEGLRIAIMQQEGIVCEAMVDGKDAPSGQYIASLLPGKIGNSDPKPPVVGDKVIVSPFESSKDIRTSTDDAPAAPSTPNGPSAQQQSLPEIDATLVPIP
ncbi:MAG: hypothetical protein R3Y56_03200 [Akkermansia sp.]